MQEIRIAEQRDIGACSRLLGILFGQEQEFAPDVRNQELGLEMIIGDASAGMVLVCEKDGEIAGMLTLLTLVSTALGKKVAMLEDMIVDPASRGQGIGSMLVEHAFAWARDNGYGRITLLTDGDNDSAHRFYGGKGFERSQMAVFRKML
ncbi:MAG: GNAT family N-acetyltransferase [Chlorobiaceae bacterium]|nr:GNAT family N-acetyltransferase [Chlorobiaceae bacterium]